MRFCSRGFPEDRPDTSPKAVKPRRWRASSPCHIPAESQAGLRVWLVYADIRRTLGVKTVHSMFRLLAPFPAYLATVWLDSKRLIADSEFARARNEVARRALALLSGTPSGTSAPGQQSLRPQQWREIEETVDAFARLSPQILLLAAVRERSSPACAVWRREFATFSPALIFPL